MPVQGLSDRTRDNRIGHIRLGIQDPNRGGAPREIDHFLLDPNTGDPETDNLLKSRFVEIYGPDPKRITVILPPFDENEVFPVWRMRFGSGIRGKSGKKICQGDGDSALYPGIAVCRQGMEGPLTVLQDLPPRYVQVKCMGRDCAYTLDKQCGVSGVLKVILPQLPTIGIWWIVTGSYNSIVNIQSGLRNLKALVGRYSKIPLVLMRRPQEIEHTEEDGSVKTRTHHILSIDFQAMGYDELVERQLRAGMLDAPPAERDVADRETALPGFSRTYQIPASQPTRALPAPQEPPKGQNGRSKGKDRGEGSKGAPKKNGQVSARDRLHKAMEEKGWSVEDIAFKASEWFGVSSWDQVTEAQADAAIKNRSLLGVVTGSIQ